MLISGISSSKFQAKANLYGIHGLERILLKI